MNQLAKLWHLKLSHVVQQIQPWIAGWATVEQTIIVHQCCCVKIETYHILLARYTWWSWDISVLCKHILWEKFLKPLYLRNSNSETNQSTRTTNEWLTPWHPGFGDQSINQLAITHLHNFFWIFHVYCPLNIIKSTAMHIATFFSEYGHIIINIIQFYTQMKLTHTQLNCQLVENLCHALHQLQLF